VWKDYPAAKAKLKLSMKKVDAIYKERGMTISKLLAAKSK